MDDRLLLPGLNFGDQIKVNHHVPQCFNFKNGYRTIRRPQTGIGKEPLKQGYDEVCASENPITYDPMLVYGCTKKTPVAPFRPHFVIYDKKTLRFLAYFRHKFPESCSEPEKIRPVHILYYLEDDTLTVLEPIVNNSGLNVGFPQGRLAKLVRRSKIAKNNNDGIFYTWKDFNIGIDIKLNGILFHITDCDPFTKNFLLANGIELNGSECLPSDPVPNERLISRVASAQCANKSSSKADDKLKRFLDYSGMVLQFDCVLDDTERPGGELITFKMFYYLEDDTIAVKELKENQEGRDHFPMLLKRTRLPKSSKANLTGDIFSPKEVWPQEYYSPSDLIVGSVVSVFGRKFLLLDCDKFTRSYYENLLRIPQPDKLELKKPSEREIKIKIPDYLGLGTPEDSLASCYNLRPKAPKKDVITYLVNANKVLRYGCRLDTIYPEDNDRDFILSYCLSDGTIQIVELAANNSGRSGGKFLSSRKLPKSGSNPHKPDYYTPKDLFIGALVQVYSHRFIIKSADLYVYKYMMSHPELFSPEVIDNLRLYHLKEGNLNDDIISMMRKEHEEYNKEQEIKKNVTVETPPAEIPPNTQERIPKPHITEGEIKRSYHETNKCDLPCDIDIQEPTDIPSDQGKVRFKEDYEK